MCVYFLEGLNKWARRVESRAGWYVCIFFKNGSYRLIQGTSHGQHNRRQRAISSKMRKQAAGERRGT